MVEGVEELLEESGKSFTEISSIGIGSAGQIDRKNGIIIGAPNLDCYNLNLKEILQINLIFQFLLLMMLKLRRLANKSLELEKVVLTLFVFLSVRELARLLLKMDT